MFLVTVVGVAREYEKCMFCVEPPLSLRGASGGNVVLFCLRLGVWNDDD